MTQAIEIEPSGAIHALWTGFNTDEVREAVAPLANIRRDGEVLVIALHEGGTTLTMRAGDVAHLYPTETK